jgi:hypothetical protein
MTNNIKMLGESAEGKNFSKILVCIDGSQSSKHALGTEYNI